MWYCFDEEKEVSKRCSVFVSFFPAAVQLPVGQRGVPREHQTLPGVQVEADREPEEEADGAGRSGQRGGAKVQGPRVFVAGQGGEDGELCAPPLKGRQVP